MTRVVNIHPESPQPRLLAQAAEFIRDGGIVALPTDSCYALGCHLGDKEAMDRIRLIRQMDERHHLTLMVPRSLGNRPFRPRQQRPVPLAQGDDAGQLHLHSRRHQGTAAPRAASQAQDHRPARARATRWRWRCSQELDEPLLTTTLQLPGDDAPLTEGWEIQDRLEDQIELILDAGHCGTEPTTVIDLTGSTPELIRAGRGSLAPFGLD